MVLAPGDYVLAADAAPPKRVLSLRLPTAVLSALRHDPQSVSQSAEQRPNASSHDKAARASVVVSVDEG